MGCVVLADDVVVLRNLMVPSTGVFPVWYDVPSLRRGSPAVRGGLTYSCTVGRFR